MKIIRDGGCNVIYKHSTETSPVGKVDAYDTRVGGMVSVEIEPGDIVIYTDTDGSEIYDLSSGWRVQ